MNLLQPFLVVITQRPQAAVLERVDFGWHPIVRRQHGDVTRGLMNRGDHLLGGQHLLRRAALIHLHRQFRHIVHREECEFARAQTNRRSDRAVDVGRQHLDRRRRPTGTDASFMRLYALNFGSRPIRKKTRVLSPDHCNRPLRVPLMRSSSVNTRTEAPGVASAAQICHFGYRPSSPARLLENATCFPSGDHVAAAHGQLLFGQSLRFLASMSNNHNCAGPSSSSPPYPA